MDGEAVPIGGRMECIVEEKNKTKGLKSKAKKA